MFQSHVELLHAFLARREAIVANIEGVLNCQKAPVEYQHDYAQLAQRFGDCFATGGLTREQAAWDDQLTQAHWDAGFTPRASPGNDLVHPVEQVVRGFNLWRLTRWPGSRGRLRFAHTLFNLQLIRSLALLCMRIWDDGADGASARLGRLQGVLDALWQGAPADQPRLLRNVRWLFPVAMSPTTDSLSAYFPAAQSIAALAEEDSVEIFRAWVLTGAGHLRSQLYQLTQQRAVALDDHALVLVTRMSNALDVALLMQGLVCLLQAYERCVHDGDAARRRELACAICQGVSPDPELFVNRLELLGPYSMLEEQFVAMDAAGTAAYTDMGRRNLAMLDTYKDLIARLAPALLADAPQCRPPDGGWSPYGALYGFASNLLELMAFKTLQPDAAIAFGMEDVFSNGGADKLAWVDDWRKLPHIRPEIAQQFAFPRAFAEAAHARVEGALRMRVAGGEQAATGKLFVVAEGTLANPRVPPLPPQYLVASDPALVAGGKAEAKDAGDLLHCRMEGEFCVSFATAQGWCAVTKDVLTDVPGAGRDAQVALPRTAAGVLLLMCPGLAVSGTGTGTG